MEGKLCSFCKPTFPMIKFWKLSVTGLRTISRWLYKYNLCLSTSQGDILNIYIFKNIFNLGAGNLNDIRVLQLGFIGLYCHQHGHSMYIQISVSKDLLSPNIPKSVSILMVNILPNILGSYPWLSDDLSDIGYQLSTYVIYCVTYALNKYVCILYIAIEGKSTEKNIYCQNQKVDVSVMNFANLMRRRLSQKNCKQLNINKVIFLKPVFIFKLVTIRQSFGKMYRYSRFWYISVTIRQTWQFLDKP